MTEKRFTFGPVSPNFAMIKDNGEPMDTEEVVDCLNEQQSIIEAKDSLLSILAKENEQLRKELKELENNYKDLLYDGGFDE